MFQFTISLSTENFSDATTTHFITLPLPILSVAFLKLSLLQAGLQLPLVAHPSASDLATGRHCALYRFIYTVGHKKRAPKLLSITLAVINRFR